MKMSAARRRETMNIHVTKATFFKYGDEAYEKIKQNNLSHENVFSQKIIVYVTLPSSVTIIAPSEVSRVVASGSLARNTST